MHNYMYNIKIIILVLIPLVLFCSCENTTVDRQEVVMLPRVYFGNTIEENDIKISDHYNRVISKAIENNSNKNIQIINYLESDEKDKPFNFSSFYQENTKYILLDLKVSHKKYRSATSRMDVYVEDVSNNFYRSMHINKNIVLPDDQQPDESIINDIEELTGIQLGEDLSSIHFESAARESALSVSVIPFYYLAGKEVQGLLAGEKNRSEDGGDAESHYRRFIGSISTTLVDGGYNPRSTMNKKYFSKIADNKSTTLAELFGVEKIVRVFLKVKLKKLDDGICEASGEANNLTIYNAGMTRISPHKVETLVRDEQCDTAISLVEMELGRKAGAEILNYLSVE